MATINFDANTVEPQAAFDPLPTNWYNVIITESEMKPTSAGDGSYLALQLKVVDGEFVNRVVFTNLNLQNKNPVAQEIAYKQLSAICHAVGVIQVADSQELHGKPLQARIAYKPPSTNKETGQEYDAGNDVKSFKAVEAGGGTAGAATATGGVGDAPPAWATAGQEQPTAEPAAETKVEPVAQEQVATQEPAQVATAEPAATTVPSGIPDKPPWAK